MADDPLLSPDHELPQPHDMQLESGKTETEAQVLPDGASSDKLPRWLIYLIPIALLLIFAVAIYSQKNQSTEETKQNIPARATNITPTESPNDTKLWNTYTSDDKQFSFKYPSDWKMSSGAATEDIIFVAPPPSECAPPNVCGGGLDGLSVSILKNPENLSLQAFIKQNKNNRFTLSNFSENVLATKQIGQPVMIDRNPPGAGFGQEVLIANGNEIIDMYCGTCSTERTDSILSTFQFLQPSTSPSGTQKICTMDAKVCPDGSTVGRTGPNCEFATCPTQ